LFSWGKAWDDFLLIFHNLGSFPEKGITTLSIYNPNQTYKQIDKAILFVQ